MRSWLAGPRPLELLPRDLLRRARRPTLERAGGLPIDELHVDLVRAPGAARRPCWRRCRRRAAVARRGRRPQRLDRRPRPRPRPARPAVGAARQRAPARSRRPARCCTSPTAATARTASIRSCGLARVRRARSSTSSPCWPGRATPPARSATRCSPSAAALSRAASPAPQRPRGAGAEPAAALDGRCDALAAARRAAASAQRERLGLPDCRPRRSARSRRPPRSARRAARLRAGEIDAAAYDGASWRPDRARRRRQESSGLDVLVHGEPERNDMVEYFGEQLAASRHRAPAGCRPTAAAASSRRSSTATSRGRRR